MQATLKELEAAKSLIGHIMPETPTYHWPLLSKRCQAEVWVKHENHTPLGAFKMRGGLVFMDQLCRDKPSCTGVITATRGNHGQSIANAARLFDKRAVIVVPEGNSVEKNAAMEALGAELIIHGEDFQAAKEHAMSLVGQDGLETVPPFHPALVQGVGTYALEFFRAQADLDTVYVPIGQGSGICGMISARDALSLKTKIVGVVAENAPAYALSFEAKEAVSTRTANTFADGVACRVPDPHALEIILNGAERIVKVSEEAIKDAMRAYFSDTHNIAEGAAATALAGLMTEQQQMRGKKVGVVLSGGNIDRADYAAIIANPIAGTKAAAA